jgi:hypothetical protein
MTFLGAGAYGVVGGLAASLVALSAAITKAGFRWPWRGQPDGIWPRFTVYAIGIVVGGIAPAVAHGQMNGSWPAFLLGIAAPAVIQNAVGLVAVSESKPAVTAEPPAPDPAPAERGSDAAQV